MKSLIFALIAVCLLSACSSSPKTVEAQQLQAHEVADYIKNFKRQYQRLSFEFDGKRYPIHFEDFDVENELLITTYENGLLLIGFDFEANEPLGDLLILEGDLSDLEQFNPTNEYESDDIKLSFDGDETIYQGTMRDVNDKSYPVRLVINESLLEAGASTITVQGNTATIKGTLGSLTYVQMQEMLANNEVDTLVLQNVLGSINDAINVYTARLVRQAGLTTVMPKDGEAYSGGVDLFAAGKKRVYERGGKLGVHAWCCLGDKDASQLSKTDPAHDSLLAYYREMMGDVDGPEFYFYTIYAAPADDIALMTEQEIMKYKLVTP